MTDLLAGWPGTAASGCADIRCEGQARDINSRGDIVGWWYFDDYKATPREVHSGGYLYRHGQFIDLPLSTADAINSRGDIAGWIGGSTSIFPTWPYPSGESPSHAAVVSQGSLVDLGTLGGDGSFASDISDHGVVVGAADRADGSRHAFAAEPGAPMRDLGTLGGTYSVAKSINAAGAIVGAATTETGAEHGFIYEHGTMADLNTRIPARVGVVVDATGINNRGQIAVDLTLPGGVTHAAILTPAP
jgi:probable HAF family extracellular repeat protein